MATAAKKTVKSAKPTKKSAKPSKPTKKTAKKQSSAGKKTKASNDKVDTLSPEFVGNLVSDLWEKCDHDTNSIEFHAAKAIYNLAKKSARLESFINDMNEAMSEVVVKHLDIVTSDSE